MAVTQILHLPSPSLTLDESPERRFIENVDRLADEYLATFDDGPEEETGRRRARQQIKPFIEWMREVANGER